MKKIVRMICFIIIFGGILCFLDHYTGKNIYSKPVWEKVKEGDVDILIMGNSHAYTAIDTKILSEAFGKEIVHLGSSAQNMGNTLEALKITLKHMKPEYILLEVNAVCLDSKAALQNEKRGMLFDNLDGVDNYFDKTAGVIKTFSWNTIPEGIFQVFRPTNMWTRWKENDKEKDYYGYEGKDSYAYGSYNFEEAISQTKQWQDEGKVGNLENYNEKALHEFLKLTEKNGVKVVLYKSPILRNAITKDINDVFKIASNYQNVVAMDNMLLNMLDMGLIFEDFYDSGHMNRRGAEKFTYYYGNILADKLGIEPDWNKVFGYKSESVVQNEDGTYTYMVNNYDENCMYKFELYVDGKCVEQTEYSKENTFSSVYDVNSKEQKVILRCSMIPERDIELGDESPSRVYIRLMYQNECYIEE